jgi:hypothetical protein
MAFLLEQRQNFLTCFDGDNARNQDFYGSMHGQLLVDHETVLNLFLPRAIA